MTRWYRWTKEMDDYLLEKFGSIGDTKLAELFEKRFPKHYQWTNKQIEKRRSYLKLKRTKEQEHWLRCLNNKDGRQFRMWITRGKMKNGEVRNWGGRKYIKIKGKIIPYHRHLVKAKKGQVVRTFEGGVKIIDRAENQRLNAKQRALLPSDLKQTVKALNELKKIIYGKENTRLTRNTF